MSAASALQTAIVARLGGDAALSAKIGPGGIRDRRIDRRDGPAVVIVEIDSRDLSTGTETGEEHLVTLQALSGEGGMKTVQAIAGDVRRLLDDAELVLAGAALVSILHRRTVCRRDAALRGHVAEIVFRAVTE
ncbi:Protein of unknown function [Rhizobium sp. RU20A]|uniref:DUF3168 domain-containing protein n=1 Tax=Rhizobium sp. RU20A TaxID=1907412 RepID=UPI0009569E34|nr:DUF3168 domain-containing protein [Rhizobium sp. RU20A]SIR15830.1 Protein of unknown function [Rhizobium sp. RU20A]